MVECCINSPRIYKFPSIDRVKFGVPLEEVCQKDIPGPLLVSTLNILSQIGLEFFGLNLEKLPVACMQKRGVDFFLTTL